MLPGDRIVEEDDLLRHEPDFFAQARDLVLADVAPVDEDRAFRRVVKPRQQSRDRRLARAARAHERDDLAGARSEVHAVQHRLAPVIRERNVLEANLVRESVQRHRAGRIDDVRLAVEKLEHPLRRRYERLHAVVYRRYLSHGPEGAPERGVKGRHLADRHPPPQHEPPHHQERRAYGHKTHDLDKGAGRGLDLLDAQVLAVDAHVLHVEALLLAPLHVEGLDDRDAFEGLLEDIDKPVAAVEPLSRGLLRLSPEHVYAEREERKHGDVKEQKPPVDDRGGQHEARYEERVEKRLAEKDLEAPPHRLNVVGESRDEAGAAHAVVEGHRKPEHVAVEVRRDAPRRAGVDLADGVLLHELRNALEEAQADEDDYRPRERAKLVPDDVVLHPVRKRQPQRFDAGEVCDLRRPRRDALVARLEERVEERYEDRQLRERQPRDRQRKQDSRYRRPLVVLDVAEEPPDVPHTRPSRTSAAFEATSAPLTPFMHFASSHSRLRHGIFSHDSCATTTRSLWQ